MTQQTFPVGTQPRLQLSEIQGDLTISTWEVDTFGLEANGEIDEIHLESDTLYLTGSNGAIELMVPAGTVLFAQDLEGDVRIRGIRLIERLQDVSGDVEIMDIAEAATLEGIEGSLAASEVAVLDVLDAVEGDVHLKNVGRVNIEVAEGDFTIEQAEVVVLGTVAGDFQASAVSSALRCGSIKGDCHVQGSPDAEVSLGQVSGDLRLEQVATLQIGNVDGDCHMGDIQHRLSVGFCSGDFWIGDIGGPLEFGAVGGDASITDVQGKINFGAVSGSLNLESAFPEGSWINGYVGGDGNLSLAPDANVRIQAWVSGDAWIEGGGTDTHEHGSLVGLIYGEGAAKVSLVIGGDLRIRCDTAPRNASFMNGFAQEMAGFASSMSDLGIALTNDLMDSLGGLNETLGSRLSQKLSQRLQGQMERARRQVEVAARRSEDYATKQSQRASKFAEKRTEQSGKQSTKQGQRGSKNSEKQSRRADRRWSYSRGRRDWNFDSEQIENLKEQARRAANEGLVGALDAVEQALSGLHFPFSSTPPPPPAHFSSTPPPMPPTHPDAPFAAPPPYPWTPAKQEPAPESVEPAMPPQPAEPVDHDEAPDVQSSGEGVGEKPLEALSSAPKAQTAAMLDQKREAILRMIAEGRITPEEGDMLLSGLDG